MLIDWFTVGAQALNFAILVWLMRHFLYKPILHAIDAREQRIAAELADAAAKEAKAGEERDELQRKNEALDQQRAELLREATDEASAERKRLLAEAREAADALEATRQQILASQARELGLAIRSRARVEVFAIVRKALADLATTSLEERMSEVFTRRLRQMHSQDKACLGEALSTAPEPSLVRSAFELPEPQRAAIRNALNETFSAEVRVRFETAALLIGGIELVASGQKVAWSIDDYLTSLEHSVAELLPEPKPQPAREGQPIEHRA